MRNANVQLMQHIQIAISHTTSYRYIVFGVLLKASKATQLQANMQIAWESTQRNKAQSKLKALFGNNCGRGHKVCANYAQHCNQVMLSHCILSSLSFTRRSLSHVLAITTPTISLQCMMACISQPSNMVQQITVFYPKLCIIRHSLYISLWLQCIVKRSQLQCNHSVSAFHDWSFDFML